MCFFIQSCEPLGVKKKKRKQKCTSFLCEPCVLPVSSSFPTPPFSTDRYPAAANLHVLATQITLLCFFPSQLLGLGKSPAPCCLPPLRLLWEPLLLEQVCKCSGKGAGPSAPQSPQLPLGSPASPLPMTPHPAAALLAASQGWTDDTFSLAPAKSHQSAAASLDPFPSVKTHVQTGRCCLLWLCLVLKEQVYLLVTSRALVALSLSYLSVCCSS